MESRPSKCISKWFRARLHSLDSQVRTSLPKCMQARLCRDKYTPCAQGNCKQWLISVRVNHWMTPDQVVTPYLWLLFTWWQDSASLCSMWGCWTWISPQQRLRKSHINVTSSQTTVNGRSGGGERPSSLYKNPWALSCLSVYIACTFKDHCPDFQLPGPFIAWCTYPAGRRDSAREPAVSNATSNWYFLRPLPQF